MNEHYVILILLLVVAVITGYALWWWDRGRQNEQLRRQDEQLRELKDRTDARETAVSIIAEATGEPQPDDPQTRHLHLVSDPKALVAQAATLLRLLSRTVRSRPHRFTSTGLVFAVLLLGAATASGRNPTMPLGQDTMPPRPPTGDWSSVPIPPTTRSSTPEPTASRTHTTAPHETHDRDVARVDQNRNVRTAERQRPTPTRSSPPAPTRTPSPSSPSRPPSATASSSPEPTGDHDSCALKVQLGRLVRVCVGGG